MLDSKRVSVVLFAMLIFGFASIFSQRRVVTEIRTLSEEHSTVVITQPQTKYNQSNQQHHTGMVVSCRARALRGHIHESLNQHTHGDILRFVRPSFSLDNGNLTRGKW